MFGPGVARMISERAGHPEPEKFNIHLVNVRLPLSEEIRHFVSHDQIAGFHRAESGMLAQGASRRLDAAGVG
jgi:hypothetical protein